MHSCVMPWPLIVLRRAAAASLLLIGCRCACASDHESRPPNVILIYMDDLGYGDVGDRGGRGYSTPHLDQLAREGRTFTDFYVAQPVCTSSRAALLTGCYPNRVGLVGALGPKDTNGLSADETTLAEIFRQRGYATGMAGKWHLGHHRVFLPTRHGFDEFLGIPYSNDMWPHHPTAAPGTYPPLPLLEGETVLDPDVTPEDQAEFTQRFTERAVQFIERNRERPFFFYLAHPQPHVPLFVSDRFRGASASGLYGDVMREIDASVGRVVETVHRLNLDQQTLILFCSDNGPWLAYGEHAGSSGGLRAGKLTTFEGGVRVPFIARWPGRIAAATVYAEPAMNIDLLPTLAALIGATPPRLPIDGRDIGGLLFGSAGASSPHDAYFFYMRDALHAVRRGDWKLTFPHRSFTVEGQPPGRDGRPGPTRPQDMELSLFHLRSDPAETQNLAAEQPEIVAQLEVLAERMRADLGDSLRDRAPTGARPAGVADPESSEDAAD